MTPEHVEAARKLLDTWTNDDAVVVRWDGPDARTYVDPAAAVAALDRAGLLRTGLEREAIAACEVAAGSDYHKTCSALAECTSIGLRSLALKQPPKPRWTMQRTASSGGCAPDRFCWRFILAPARYIILNYATEAEADSFLAALNACDTEPTNA